MVEAAVVGDRTSEASRKHPHCDHLADEHTVECGGPRDLFYACIACGTMIAAHGMCDQCSRAWGLGFEEGKASLVTPATTEAPIDWPRRFRDIADRLENRYAGPSLDGYDLVSGLRAAANLMTGSDGSFVHEDVVVGDNRNVEEIDSLMLREYEARVDVAMAFVEGEFVARPATPSKGDGNG